MRDRELYGKILGIEPPWTVVEVDLHLESGEVVVKLARASGAELECPECGQHCRRYDSRERRWRHLDTCQYRTVLVAEIPRVECPEHGVHQVRVPWADVGSRFTALFETLVIDWLQEANITAVARRLRLSWDQVCGVMERAVARGLRRRKLEVSTSLGVDETSFRRRHEYLWLENPRTMSRARRGSFKALRHASLKTARAWALKELASHLWSYRHRGWARRAWNRWYASAIRSRLEPVKRVARNVKRYLEGIVNAIVLGVTNARIEAVNTHIQWIKYSARGFRNRDRFRAAIYFRLGGLDLYPDCLSLTHTKA